MITEATSHSGQEPAAPPEMVHAARKLRREFARIQMENEFAVEEVLTKVSILRKEFVHLHRYNPIEHVTSRVKSPASTLRKIARLGIEPTPNMIRETVTDMAGVRITCSFIADTYRVLEVLTSQADVKVLKVKDYIATPKPNGYRSLHALIEIPVFLSTGPVPVTVELQVRTIAMDFWASLEHKIFYKYSGAVPPHLIERLAAAAGMSEQLDEQMEQLYTEVRDYQEADDEHLDDQLLTQLLQNVKNPTQTDDSSHEEEH